ncbi:hypothetical protein A2U01_0014763 [Trifolium medium]|uniref:Uncharacterized protein n=1 Tax=Trifolium medium TaxID=97028 RepID=A0A392N1X5_9FABA|nr:hypothetical protein [Trifolium medium]
MDAYHGGAKGRNGVFIRRMFGLPLYSAIDDTATWQRMEEYEYKGREGSGRGRHK